MDIFTKSIMPNILNALILIAFSLLSAFCVGLYATKKWGGSKLKNNLGFTGIILAFSVLSICFFGLSAITVRGIILCLILLFASFSDIKTRECSDWLHVMILIAAFIGCNFNNLPNMILSAVFVWLIIFVTVVISKSNIGGADLKCATACAFLLGFEKGIVGLTVGMLLSVLFNAFKKEENREEGFPLIPYLTAGYLAVYLI